ncbi:hypothetical protein OIDMADRAFT_20719 [Oidiodendron maius Zn]|uniref:Uncharacterized protein n=1 Tax=Oidiodendron maius (strain Zn) TaxID=913774 RepID=A0A0C3CBH5_OIDMZ|nr:hypothetical protein OIDMADRAFT_20719 [Oidiodendron maius Zn]
MIGISAFERITSMGRYLRACIKFRPSGKYRYIRSPGILQKRKKCVGADWSRDSTRPVSPSRFRPYHALLNSIALVLISL